MWDLSSPTRDWTCVPCIARWILNHWATREVPGLFLLKKKNPFCRLAILILVESNTGITHILTGPNRIYWPVTTKSVSFAAKLLNCSGKHESGRRRHSLCHVLGKAPNSFNISHCTYAFPSVIFFFFFFDIGWSLFPLKDSHQTVFLKK